MSRRAYWPARDDVDGWTALANTALQRETLAVDLAENAAWAATMRALLAEKLDYEEFTARRLEALRERLRVRKLAQSNLRYKYGFKKRSARLVRAAIRESLS